MVSIKQQIQQFIEQLPDDVTWEDVQYHLYVHQKVERARRDIEAGRTYSSEQVRERMSRWTDPSAGRESP